MGWRQYSQARWPGWAVGRWWWSCDRTLPGDPSCPGWSWTCCGSSAVTTHPTRSSAQRGGVGQSHAKHTLLILCGIKTPSGLVKHSPFLPSMEEASGCHRESSVWRRQNCCCAALAPGPTWWSLAAVPPWNPWLGNSACRCSHRWVRSEPSGPRRWCCVSDIPAKIYREKETHMMSQQSSWLVFLFCLYHMYTIIFCFLF